jgi:hypothetical protein
VKFLLQIEMQRAAQRVSQTETDTTGKSGSSVFDVEQQVTATANSAPPKQGMNVHCILA